MMIHALKRLGCDCLIVAGLSTMSGVAQAAQYTNPIPVASDRWYDLGAGPLSVSALGPEWANVAFIQADTQPSSSIVAQGNGEPLRDRRFFCETTHVYARSSLQSNQQTLLIVTAPDLGNGGCGTSLPSAVVTGQAIIAATGTAVQLASNTLVNGIVVKAKSTNNPSCGAIGASSVSNAYTGSGNGYGTCPGEAASFAVSNSNMIWVNGTAGDIFTFEGN